MMNMIKQILPFAKRIWYFEFRPEIRNVNKKILKIQ